MDGARAEAPLLVAEVERLLQLHGSNGSFQGYGQAFLAAARATSGQLHAPEPQSLSYPFELPIGTRVHLGQLLAEGRPIDANAALLWVTGSPETRLRTPGQRCFAELSQLWCVRFTERHPGGLKIRVPQRRIKLSYRAASGTFVVDIPGPHESLPDIAGITAPLQGLRDLLEVCMTELEPYSRLLGRRPEARNTLEATMLLPQPIREAAGGKALDAARAQLDALLGSDGMAVTSLRRLVDALGPEPTTEGLTHQNATRITLMLDRLDVGVEPDRRYGGVLAAGDAMVVAFRAPGGAPVAPGSAAYESARLAAEIGVMAASSDGEMSSAELEFLLHEAYSVPGLADHERLRLKAFLRSVRTEPPRLPIALKRAGGLPADERAAIARAAAGAVMAGGYASAEEVTFLERLHDAFGLERRGLYTILHQGAAATAARAAEPVVVERPATQGGPFRIPPQPVTPVPQDGGLVIDMTKVGAILRETREVAEVLAPIYEDEETAPASPIIEAKPDPVSGRFSGLEADHAHFLKVLRERERWVRAEFEAKAREFGLMPDGAIETINEWAYDALGDELIEDGEFLSINVALLSGAPGEAA